jgi:hypothetical protein
VDAGKFDALSLSCTVDPAGAEHFSIFPLLPTPCSIISQFATSDAVVLLPCANCKVIRSNKEGVFFRVKPRGLGSSKGSQGLAEGTDTGIGGKIRLIFLVRQYCESSDLFKEGCSPPPLP